MAELIFPNITGQYQQGLAFGTEMRQNKEAEQRRNRLADLASQAYGADPSSRQGLLQQAVGVDPQAGLALEQGINQSNQARVAQLSQKARLFVSMAESGNEQAVVSMYPQLAQEARQLGLGDVPLEYSPQFLPALKQFAAMGGGGEDLKSLRVGGNGNYWAIRGGQFVDTGVPADPRFKIMEGAGGIYGINERTLGASPVQLGGQPQARAPGEVPFAIDPSLPPEVQQAIRANEGQFAAAPEGANIAIGPQAGGQLQPAPKTPAGYQAVPGGLAPIPGGPAQVAMEARADAAAARKAAEDAKAEQKRQATAQRQGEAVAAAEQLVGSIDQLMASPGFEALGTALGDAQINIPLVRTAAKDADAQLKNIAGQVALTTMARLKALSSQGATGFGALTAPELKLLENSIATLQAEKVSNQELKRSLQTIRDKMAKITSWQAPAEDSRGTPAAGQVEDGYRFKGGDPANPNNWEPE